MKKNNNNNQTFKTSLKISAAFVAGLAFMHIGSSHFNAPQIQNIQTVQSQAPQIVKQARELPLANADKSKTASMVQNNLTVPPNQVGSYLAARSAQTHNDWDNAFRFYNRAHTLNKFHDLADNILTERAFLTALISGNSDQAEKLATQITEQGGGELALIVGAVADIKKGDFAAAHATLKDINTNAFGGFAVPMLQAWAAAANQDKVAALNSLAASDFSQDTAYIFQKALILDFMGDAQADKSYRAALKKGVDLRETLLAANYFERAGDHDMARQIYTLINTREPGNVYTQNALARLENGDVPAKEINSPIEGFGYTLFTMSRLLAEKKAYDSSLIYARIAEDLGYEGEELDILMGNLQLHYKDYKRALSYYDNVQSGDLLYKTAQLQKLRTWKAANDTASALTLLEEWQKNDHYKIEALMHKGDLYSQQKDFSMAFQAYDHAIQTLNSDDSPTDWRLFYARGIMHDQLGNWDAAEQDFLTALEREPNNPDVLNFLGYSWIDQGIKLEQAMDMIEKAIALDPYDSYILDSYGWAYYKMGDYRQAAKWLERALEITPGDVTMNDHLGDAYWQMGRTQEASYQWNRALGLSENETIRNDIQAKLKNGLQEPSLIEETDSATTKPLGKGPRIQ